MLDASHSYQMCTTNASLSLDCTISETFYVSFDLNNKNNENENENKRKSDKWIKKEKSTTAPTTRNLAVISMGNIVMILSLCSPCKCTVACGQINAHCGNELFSLLQFLEWCANIYLIYNGLDNSVTMTFVAHLYNLFAKF